MPPPRGRNGTGVPSAGMATLDVIVLDINVEKKLAFVRDNFGEGRKVSLRTSRTNRTPQIGDRWIIDRSLGFWTFAAYHGALDAAPVVTPTGGGGKSDRLLVAASNAADWEKDAATYVCTGDWGNPVDDQNLVDAVNAARSAWQGTPVYLSSGDFHFAEPVRGRSWVSLLGISPLHTYLHWEGVGAVSAPLLGGFGEMGGFYFDGRDQGSGINSVGIDASADRVHDIHVESGADVAVVCGQSRSIIERLYPQSIYHTFIRVVNNRVMLRDVQFGSGWSALYPAVRIAGSQTSVSGCIANPAGTLIIIEEGGDMAVISENQFWATSTIAEPLIDVSAQECEIVRNRLAGTSASDNLPARFSAETAGCVFAYNTVRGFILPIEDLGSGNVVEPNVVLP